MLGMTDQNEDLIRLQKSSITLSNGPDAKPVSYPSSIFICAQVLSLIESTALKKFVVHSGPSQNLASSPLLLWVFNPDIYYSCSAFEGNSTLSNVSQDVDRGQNEEGNDNMKPQSVSQDNAVQQEPRQHDDKNPNSDDVSQIYGEPPEGQKVTGDMHFEIPLPQNRSNTQGTSAQYIPQVTPTETSLSGSTPQPSSVTAGTTHKGPSTGAEEQNDHINLVHRAAKIFYQPFPSDTNVQEFLDTNATTHEELFLPNPSDFDALKDTLEKMTAMLPASARIFQDWKVGLLNRHEKNPSGLGVMQENPLARGIQAKDGRVTRWDPGHGAEGLYA